MIHVGDCLKVMAGMDAESVDAVVTDPPYGIEFMGREWDSGHRLWAATGTPHQGRVDGKGGMETWPPRPRYQAGHAFQAWCEAWGREALRVTKPGGYLLAFGGTRTHHRLVCGLEDAGWIIRDELTWVYASGFPKGRANLKPAHEPIVLARKPGPLRPLNIEENRIGVRDESKMYVQPRPTTDDGGSSWKKGEHVPFHYGESGGRWPSNLLLSDPELFDEPNPWVVGSGATDAGGGFGVRGQRTVGEGWASRNGDANSWRGTGETVGYGDSGGYSRFFIIPKADRADREPVLRGQLTEQPREGQYASIQDGRPHTPEGYVYDRKARENSHATVKPTDLMRHLIRLVTPPGGTVLDCFAGSGSTIVAAELEGFPWIAIEREPEYVAIMEARLNGTQRGLGLDTPLVGEPRKASLNKPTEWKSDGDGAPGDRAYGRGVGRRDAGTVRGGYDQHLMESKPEKPTADTAPLFDEEPAA